MDKLTFASLARQIEEGIHRGYAMDDIINAVIWSITYGLPLREFLEGRTDLTLPRLRSFLRNNLNEKDALSSYQELSSTVQRAKETPQDFMIRLMNMRQCTFFTSQEDDAPVRYERLLEVLNRAINMKEKRMTQRSKAKVNEVHIESQTNKEITALTAGLTDLKACIMAMQQRRDQSIPTHYGACPRGKYKQGQS